MSLKQSLGRTLHKFAADPLGTAANVWRKAVTDPLRYGAPPGTGSTGAYDARRYWSNRFARHAESLRGPGDEGLSDEQNRREYAAAGAQFLGLCRSLPLHYAAANVLEIGPGTGFYTDLLRQLGVRRYTGLDIAGSLLPALSERFAGFAFAQADAAALPFAPAAGGPGPGAFDLIAIIDVIEHIVERRTLAAALGGLEGLLAPGGRLLIAPLMASSGRHLFYVHFWSQADVCACLPHLRLETVTPFRGGELAAFVRPPTA